MTITPCDTHLDNPTNPTNNWTRSKSSRSVLDALNNDFDNALTGALRKSFVGILVDPANQHGNSLSSPAKGSSEGFILNADMATVIDLDDNVDPISANVKCRVTGLGEICPDSPNQSTALE